MIDLITHHKISMGAGAVLLAFALWYAMVPASPPAGEPLLTATPAGAADTGVVEVLLRLRAIRLDSAIFSEPAFTALKDFSVEIVPEPVGRPNPFAPLGRDVQPTSSTTKGAVIFTKPSNPASGTDRR